MDTLFSDLRFLVDKHLSAIEDVFINNNQVYIKPKNIKRAVKNRDWRWILYFLQRYRYQQSVVSEAYCAAIGYKYEDLQKVLKLESPIEYDFIYSLAKGGYYKELDDLANTTAYNKYAVLSGLIAANDIDTIKSNRYKHPKDLSTSMIAKKSKTQRIEIFEHYRQLGAFRFCIDKIEYKIIHGAQIDEQDIDLNRYPYPSREYVIVGLIKRGYTELIEKIVYQRDNIHEKLGFLEGLVLTHQYDKVDEFFSKSGCQYDPIRSTICKAAVEIDNLQLFIRFFDPNEEHFFDDAVRYDSYSIVKHILEHYPRTDLQVYDSTIVGDPKIAELLVKHNINFKLNPREYEKYKFNVCYDILTKYLL